MSAERSQPVPEPLLPTGLYESVLTTGLKRRLGEAAHIARKVHGADAGDVLGRFLGEVCHRAMEASENPVELASALLGAITRTLGPEALPLADGLSEPLAELLEVLDPALAALGSAASNAHSASKRPGIPLGAHDVLMNLRDEARIGDELKREIASANKVDLLCSFLIFSGFRLLRPAIVELMNRGGTLRVLTTTYMGVTERRVLEDLVDLGAQVRIAYGRRTKLHAKAWILERDTGYSTAYIGSSNLSHSAMIDGIEWNVRLAATRDPVTFAKLEGAFGHYWRSDEFEDFDPERFETEKRAVMGGGANVASNILAIELRPYGYQERILDELQVDRTIHKHQRSLVVAATGTGKTVIAALDFARQKRQNQSTKLLFIAHRKEILEKSRATFRHALRDPNFGDLLVDGERPTALTAVFASIQSLTGDRLTQIPTDQFDWIIIDEFHHASAPTYRSLIEHFDPQFLLGLTATPERADGVSVQDEYFEGRITSEVRLWDALDRELLSPFHYFGVEDGTDLSKAKWTPQGYAVGEVATHFIGHHQRLRSILLSIDQYVPDPAKMRAVGFCVSVQHATWMAEQFVAKGFKAASLSGQSSKADRRQALSDLSSGALQALFVVDLLNEGIDVPSIDTILFLRPTDSPVLFVQQLGRGLRLAEGKRCLTVLDFIGRHHRRYRLDRRFAALTKARSRREVEYEINGGTMSAPLGCEIVLERQARDVVLAQLRQALDAKQPALVKELRALGPTTSLSQFLDSCRLGIEDLYRGDSTTWTGLRRAAGFANSPPGPNETLILRALSRATHVDDISRTDALAAIGAGKAGTLPPSAQAMAYVLLFGRQGTDDLTGSLSRLATEEPEIAAELVQLAALLRQRLKRVPNDPIRPDVPLCVHGTYSLFEISLALGYCDPGSPNVPVAGVMHRPALKLDAFFITVNKSERAYSPGTMYRDYALGNDRFHWESQNTTSPTSPTGARYIDHEAKGHEIWLFARANKKGRGGGAAPYTFLGPASYATHRGSCPIAFEWELLTPIPASKLPTLSL